MLSVAESAKILKVSPARVRALIKAGKLPAIKYGREWLLKKEDVLQRLLSHPHAGRPKIAPSEQTEVSINEQDFMSVKAHEAYELCKEIFKYCPSECMMNNAKSQEEASFYMAASSFFLQEKQAELVKAGAY